MKLTPEQIIEVGIAVQEEVNARATNLATYSSTLPFSSIQIARMSDIHLTVFNNLVKSVQDRLRKG